MKIVLNNILLICAIVKISAAQPNTNTQAGYTKDSDTCKKYNENLHKMWAILSKYINSKDPLNEQALHNIAVMVDAYLEHQNKNKPEEEVFRPDDTTKSERKNDKIREVLKNIKKLLGTVDAITKIKEMILLNFKPTYEEQGPDCKQINEDNLFSSIALSYKIYLDNVKCRGDDDLRLLRARVQLRREQPNSEQITSQRFHDFYDGVDIGIIDEAEPTNQFHGDKMPIINYPRSSGRVNERTRTRRSSRSIFRRINSSSPSTLGDQSKSVGRTSTLFNNEINARLDEFCIKYAKRKFLKTLRVIIERFNDLRDCLHDNTLRSLNKTTKTPKGLRYTQPMSRISDNNIQLMASMRPGKQGEIRTNNYGDKLKARQEVPKAILAVPSHTRPLLLQLLPYYSSQNNKQQKKYPFDYSAPSVYNFDNNYKSFLYTPNANSQTTNKSLKTQFASNGINNDNNIQNNKNEQNAKASINRQGQKRKDSNTLAIKSDRSEPLNTNNVISKDLLQDTVGVNTVRKVLTELQNSSLQNAQLDLNNIALNNQKGFVELSYLVKYPKSIVYRPQYLVKNILSYDNFIKVAGHVYVKDEEKQLLKIQRFLPDNNTQVLFENREVKSPLTIHDIINEANKNSVIERTSGTINNENHAHSILKLVEKDKASNILCHTDSLTEGEIIVTVNPLPMQEHKMQTGAKQLYSNVRDEIQTNTDHAESSKDFKISFNVNPTDSLQKDRIETDLKQADFNLQDETNRDSYPASSFRKHKITFNPNLADFWQEDKVETDRKQIDFKKQDEMNSEKYPASPFIRNDMTSNVDSTTSLQEEKVKTDEHQANLTRTYKTDIDMDSVDHLKEDTIVIDVYPTDSLQVDKDITYIEQTDLSMERDVNTDVDHADPSRENKMVANAKPVNYLQKNKVEIYDHLAVLPQLGKTDNDKDHVDFLRGGKLITNINLADSLTKDKFQTNVDQAHSIPKDFYLQSKLKQINNDINQAASLAQDKIVKNVNITHSWQKAKAKTDVLQGDSTRKDIIGTDIGHSGSLRQNKIINNFKSADFSQGKPNIAQSDSIQRNQFETDIDRVPIRQDDNISNLVPDSIRKDRINNNSDTTYAKSLRIVEIVTSIYPTYALQRVKLQNDAVQTVSSRKNKMDSKDKAAAFLVDLAKNGNDAYNTDPLIDNKNKAVVHDVYFRSKDGTVTTQTRNKIAIGRINPIAKSEISTDVIKVRPLQKRTSTNFNSDPLSATNENDDHVDIETASLRYDINTAKTNLNTTSEASMKLATYEAGSAAFTVRSLWDK